MLAKGPLVKHKETRSQVQHINIKKRPDVVWLMLRKVQVKYNKCTEKIYIICGRLYLKLLEKNSLLYWQSYLRQFSTIKMIYFCTEETQPQHGWQKLKLRSEYHVFLCSINQTRSSNFCRNSICIVSLYSSDIETKTALELRAAKLKTYSASSTSLHQR